MRPVHRDITIPPCTQDETVHKAYIDGIKDGLNQGYEEGWERGYDAGHEQGLEDCCGK